MLVWLRSSSISPVTAVIAMGVSCRFCSRNCAVTTISSSSSLASALQVGAVPNANITAIATDNCLGTYRSSISGSMYVSTGFVQIPQDLCRETTPGARIGHVCRQNMKPRFRWLKLPMLGAMPAQVRVSHAEPGGQRRGVLIGGHRGNEAAAAHVLRAADLQQRVVAIDRAARAPRRRPRTARHPRRDPSHRRSRSACGRSPNA